MIRHSLLFTSSNGHSDSSHAVAPEFFTDLNLDQVVNAIVAQKQEYNLAPGG